MDLCLLSNFSSGTNSGHLEESENHYPGQLVKSADCIGYHRAVPRWETECWGWRWERGKLREVSWMSYRARRGEIETNRWSARLPAKTSQVQAPCHVIHEDVFGFTETKASSPSDVIQSGCLSIWSYFVVVLYTAFCVQQEIRYRQRCRQTFHPHCLFHTHPLNMHKENLGT